MRILFIAHQYLFGNGGGVFATRAYINAFAEIADEITLCFPMKKGGEPIGINPKVRLIPIWDKRSKIRKGIDLLFGQSNRFRKIEKSLLYGDYDLVVFNGSVTVHGLIDVFKRRGIKVITIFHNYAYEYYRDSTRFPMRIPTLFWINRIEGEAVRKSDLCLTLTRADKDLLKEHYGMGKEIIEVLGTFEYERKHHSISKDVEEAKFLITGNLSAMQTENSLLPWIDDYYPILKEVFPESTLTLAGKSPSQALIQKARENDINIISSPKSMQPILAEARYYICATSLGGGLKLRVMDGLSAGLPVICHKVSARGYEEFIKNGVLLVYDDKETFKEQLGRLKTLVINKKDTIDLYEALFSFDSGLKRLEDILRKRNYL